MYTQNKPQKTSLYINTAKTGEYIEQKIRRILNNKEPIKDSAPRVFTERKDGVLPEYDIRADKWEAAVTLTSAIQRSHIDKREERIGEKTWDTMDDTAKKTFREKYPNNPLSKTEGGEGKP